MSYSKNSVRTIGREEEVNHNDNGASHQPIVGEDNMVLAISAHSHPLQTLRSRRAEAADEFPDDDALRPMRGMIFAVLGSVLIFWLPLALLISL